jgi:hypothetical protein
LAVVAFPANAHFGFGSMRSKNDFERPSQQLYFNNWIKSATLIQEVPIPIRLLLGGMCRLTFSTASAKLGRACKCQYDLSSLERT